MVWLLFKRPIWWKYPIKELMCFALNTKTSNPQYYIRPSLPSWMVCEFAANVQRSWRSWETWRGERGPSLPFPARSTWSWASCCSTSEAHPQKASFSWVVWWLVCLCSASDNIPKADEIRTLVKDIWDTRIAKLRLSADRFISQMEAHARVRRARHLHGFQSGPGCSSHLFFILITIWIKYLLQ